MYVRLKMLILMFLLYRLQSLGLTGGLSQNRRGIILKNKDPGQFDFELFFIASCCRCNFHVVQYILSLKIQYSVFVKISVVRFLNMKYIKYICTQNTELNLHLNSDSGTLCTHSEYKIQKTPLLRFWNKIHHCIPIHTHKKIVKYSVILKYRIQYIVYRYIHHVILQPCSQNIVYIIQI